MARLIVGSIFTGTGGLDLGFEQAGCEIRWMCEINPSCREELRKNWPEVPIYEDIRSIRGSAGGSADEVEVVADTIGTGKWTKCVGLRREGAIPDASRNGLWPRSNTGSSLVEPIDVLIGGFPCQDISLAGKGAGLDGARSGLWWEFYRLIGELRPRYVCLENVAALVVRGLPAILGALSTLGYDAEWTIVSAASLGAPHLRERLFVVAYPCAGRWRRGRNAKVRGSPALCRQEVADAQRLRLNSELRKSQGQQLESGWQTRRKPTTSDTQGETVIGSVCRVVDGIPEGLDETGITNADALQARSDQVLPSVQSPDDSQSIQRDAGRHDEVQGEKVLQPDVCGGGTDQGQPNSVSLLQAGRKVQEESVRRMWNNRGAGQSPHERGLYGQSTEELEDLVCFLSYTMALEEWEDYAATHGFDMQGLRDAYRELGYVREALSAIPQIWRSLTDEEKAWVALRVSSGSPWCLEWPGTPRTTRGQPGRVDRLRSLGNAVVPQVAEYVARCIMQHAETT